MSGIELGGEGEGKSDIAKVIARKNSAVQQCYERALRENAEEGGKVKVSFTVGTLPGRTYRLQYKNGLADAAWTDLPPDRVADGSSMTFTDSMGAHLQRFYRVVQVD